MSDSFATPWTIAYQHGTRTRITIARRSQAADKTLQRNTEERLLCKTSRRNCATNERRGIRCRKEKREHTTGERSSIQPTEETTHPLLSDTRTAHLLPKRKWQDKHQIQERRGT